MSFQSLQAMRHFSPDTHFHGLVNGPNCVTIIVLDWKVSATGGFKKNNRNVSWSPGCFESESLTCLMWSVNITVNFFKVMLPSTLSCCVLRLFLGNLIVHSTDKHNQYQVSVLCLAVPDIFWLPCYFLHCIILCPVFLNVLFCVILCHLCQCGRI